MATRKKAGSPSKSAPKKKATKTAGKTAAKVSGKARVKSNTQAKARVTSKPPAGKSKAASKKTTATARKQAANQARQSGLMEAMKNFIRTRGLEFLQDPNISSIGIGYKVRGETPTNEISIQFTVNEKAGEGAAPDLAAAQLETLNTRMIPKTLVIDGVEVPTDVLERRFTPDFRVIEEVTTSERKLRLDPVVPGISVGNRKVTAGTIGCIVFDKDNGAPYILSNWHVLNGPTGEIGDDIVQPGPSDDNRLDQNRLGKLVRSHLGHAGDCAIASIEDRNFSREIIDLGVSVDQLGEPELGDKVMKSGRTTKVTHGLVTRIHTISKLNYGGTMGMQEIGGFEIEVDPDHVPDNGEVSMGGDSGSVWMFKGANGKPTNVMAGLHFAGEGATDPHEHAIACYPKSVFEKLGIVLTQQQVEPEEAAKGYSQDFLSKRVTKPTLLSANRKKAVELNGSEVIPYTHFSLALNKDRRFAFWVGWNIDGARIRKVKRAGFKLDGRLPAEVQAGEDLYRNNALDRGHIARRADLCWGSQTEAEQANKDSSLFPNIAPQMEDFNQSSQGGLWGELENAVFEETDVEDLRVSVFGGPVFQADDREYRGFRIPREYWKLIAWVEDGKLKTKGFLLTQNLNQLEVLDLDEFRVFQVTVTEIESRCGLRFSTALRNADSFPEALEALPEAEAVRAPLNSLAEIDWS